MIAECNDPKTRYLKAVDTYPQPYIWFYSGTLWKENTLRQLRSKLKMLQNRALRAGKKSWWDHKSHIALKESMS